jgi:effector-binding domain-containing protein
MDAQAELEIEIIEQTGRLLAATRFAGDLQRIGQRMADAFGTVADHLEQDGMVVTGPAVAAYEMSDDGFTVVAGFPVTGSFEGDSSVVPFRLPAGPVITCVHVGPYEELAATYDRLREVARGHGRLVDEHLMWEEYLTGPGTPPDQIRTRVLWPLLPA